LPGVCLAPYVALSGFDYPLSGFLLPEPLSHLSGPSTLGIFPFRVFLPSKSAASFEAVCSHALRADAPGLGNKQTPDSRAFLPSKSRILKPGIAQKSEPLLSWGFASLRLYPLQPCRLFPAHSSFALSVYPSHKTVTTNPVL
jgi:hypothetical protein